MAIFCVTVAPASAALRPASDVEKSSIARSLDTTPACLDFRVSDVRAPSALWAAGGSASNDPPCDRLGNGLTFLESRDAGASWRVVQQGPSDPGTTCDSWSPVPENVVLDFKECDPSARRPAKLTACSSKSTKRIADRSRLTRRVRNHPTIRRVYQGDMPTLLYAYCGDLDGDGDTDRIARYDGPTVSSPGAVAVLQRGADGRYAVKYFYAGDAIWGGRNDLSVIGFNQFRYYRPRYSGQDSNCCPSRLVQVDVSYRNGKFIDSRSTIANS